MRTPITRAAEDLHSPWAEWVAQRSSRDHGHLLVLRPAEPLLPAAARSPPSAARDDLGTSWNRIGSDGSAHTRPSIIHHHVTVEHPLRTGPNTVKCQLPALPKCTEAEKRSLWPVQTDFWKVLSVCMDASGMIKPNSYYRQYKHLSSVQHLWDSTLKANSISEWLQLFTLQILLE